MYTHTKKKDLYNCIILHTKWLKSLLKSTVGEILQGVDILTKVEFSLLVRTKGKSRDKTYMIKHLKG